MPLKLGKMKQHGPLHVVEKLIKNSCKLEPHSMLIIVWREIKVLADSLFEGMKSCVFLTTFQNSRTIHRDKRLENQDVL